MWGRGTVVFIILLYLTDVLMAQETMPVAAWLFPGADWRPSGKVRLVGELGYNPYLHTGLVYPQAFITVHRNIVLNPAYIYAVQKRGGTDAVQEHYLMNAVIFQASYHHFTIDSRNMLWSRFTTDIDVRHYYRNRLRLAQSFRIGQTSLRLYAYDEIFYLFNQQEVARNRPALGISGDVFSRMNLDITYIRQWDKYTGRLHLFFITGIWQLQVHRTQKPSY